MKVMNIILWILLSAAYCAFWAVAIWFFFGISEALGIAAAAASALITAALVLYIIKKAKYYKALSKKALSGENKREEN